MIKIENYEVMGWDHAIRGMRNPMNSWEKSDSYWTYIEDEKTIETAKYQFFLGENDRNLMIKLRNAGTDHRKFMRMIAVYVDITAPLYFLKEFDTYKIGTVSNSCSTMHKIAAKPFELSDFSHELLFSSSIDVLEKTIEHLNACRDSYVYLKSIGKDNRQCWDQMIQLLPSSYNQKRTIMLNYEVLANMYKSRKAHKLNEWVEFCKWIETLPAAQELICGDTE